MVRVKIMVRDPKSGVPDEGSLFFELPQLPNVGDYISIQHPEHKSEWGEDLIVRHIWWRLRHPETRYGEEVTGSVREIVLECDPAIGPWSSDKWRDSLGFMEEQGVAVERLDLKRLSVREDEIGS